MIKRVAALFLFLSMIGMICVWLSIPEYEIPEYRQVKEQYRQSDRFLLDYKYRILDERRIDPHGRRLEWKSLRELSPSLTKLVILAEDKRFWSHHGVDLIAFGSSFWDGIVSGRMRGASTITMQLVSFLCPEIKPTQKRRTVRQKFDQIWLARSIEKSWTKEEILEAYLNLVSFRGELQGINSAARGLFRKSPHGLTDLESIVLASLIRAPNSSPEKVANRAELLASKIGSTGKGAAGSLVTKVLSYPYFVKPYSQAAPLIAKRLLAGVGGENSVRCSLDQDIQNFANSIVRRHLMDLEKQNVRDATLLVVENQSGFVRAYVGNGGTYSSARHVDGIRALRQAGSTLKPFLYAEAFSRKILTPASLLDDSILNIPVIGGIYRPSNYDHLYRGPVTCRVALASSLNIPAVRTIGLLGEDRFVSRLRSLGFEGLEEAEIYGPSIALGSADVSLWNLVNAFRTLANKGVWTPLRLLPDSESNDKVRRVFSEEVVFLISSILSDRESRSSTFSLESPLSTRFWSAAKTGTSKDMRDNWCIGYSSEYTVGAWVGNFSGDPMWNVSGITGAAPLWVEMMNFLHRTQPSSPPEVPSGVKKQVVRFAKLGLEKEEWFLIGTEVDEIEPGRTQAAPSRISYPAAGTVVALDPDIPIEQQRMYFESSPASGSHYWYLDGQDMGPASALVIWKPMEGAHKLQLKTKNGQITDEVSFFVRGFAPKPEVSGE